MVASICVFPSENIVKYIDKLRRVKVGPCGIINKLTTLKHGISLSIRSVPESEEERNTIKRARIVETNINGIIKALRSESREISAQKRDLKQEVDDDREAVLDFLTNEQLSHMVEFWPNEITSLNQR